MSNVNSKIFSHTHYGVSTIAAVLYAVAWLLGNQVHAGVSATTVLPAVVVTAPRVYTSVATLDPIVVTGHRVLQASYATLEPVVVLASRNIASGPTMQPAVFTTSMPIASAAGIDSTPRSQGLIAKVSNWVISALLK